jgi:hypothetical protein
MPRVCFGLCLLIPMLAHGTPTRVPGERWWGVVVGVSHYEHLDPSFSLDGPPNDVPLVLTWLARQQVPRRHLTVLADQVPGVDGLPTRAAILKALASLPTRMQAGDIAFLYFAGHGSLQPQAGGNWSKADGFEETFLPGDVGRWNDAAGGVEGAIMGSDVGHAVEALRERGIFVWLVFDSCHSATMARAVGIRGLRARAVPPELLGAPIWRPLDASQPMAPFLRLVEMQRPDLPGGYVAFYAAQTDDIAPEMPLPLGESDRRVHGLFTYALLKSLGATGVGSYRDVAHRILAYYATTYPATTPDFEGDQDRPIGAPQLPLLPPGNWPAQNMGAEFHIDAGRFNGITAGSLLALAAPLSAGAGSSALGLLRVRRSTLTDAWADPVSDPKELRRWHVPGDKTAETGAGIARLIERSWDLSVRIAGPAACFGALSEPFGCSTGRDNSAAQPAIERAKRLLGEPGEVPGGAQLSEDASAADLLMLVEGQRLYILRPTPAEPAAALENSAAVSLDAPDAAPRLQEALLRATRVVGLLRLAAEMPGRPNTLLADLRARDASGAWKTLGLANSDRVPLSAELAIRLRNMGATDLDVTVLAIDERFAITPVFPLDQESNRLRHGAAQIEVPGWAAATGRYELLFITDEARPGSPHDLSYLAQPGVTRGAAGSGFAALLERLGFDRRATRSAAPGQERAEAIRVLRYQVSDQVARQ